jgi:hypothetical protein
MSASLEMKRHVAKLSRFSISTKGIRLDSPDSKSILFVELPSNRRFVAHAEPDRRETFRPASVVDCGLKQLSTDTATPRFLPNEGAPNQRLVSQLRPLLTSKPKDPHHVVLESAENHHIWTALQIITNYFGRRDEIVLGRRDESQRLLHCRFSQQIKKLGCIIRHKLSDLQFHLALTLRSQCVHESLHPVRISGTDRNVFDDAASDN